MVLGLGLKIEVKRLGGKRPGIQVSGTRAENRGETTRGETTRGRNVLPLLHVSQYMMWRLYLAFVNC